MNKYLSIGEVCLLLGISLSTAYRRLKAGIIIPAFRTFGGHRRFDRKKILPDAAAHQLRAVTYARVSSADQKTDLQTQSNKLKSWAEQKYAGGHHLPDFMANDLTATKRTLPEHLTWQ